MAAKTKGQGRLENSTVTDRGSDKGGWVIFIAHQGCHAVTINRRRVLRSPEYSKKHGTRSARVTTRVGGDLSGDSGQGGGGGGGRRSMCVTHEYRGMGGGGGGGVCHRDNSTEVTAENGAKQAAKCLLVKTAHRSRLQCHRGYQAGPHLPHHLPFKVHQFATPHPYPYPHSRKQGCTPSWDSKSLCMFKQR